MCTVCHEVESSTREVKPRGCDEICANGHRHQIQDRELVLYAPDEFYPLTSLLFEIPYDDDDLKTRNMLLTKALSQDSVDVFVDALQEIDDSGRARMLFGGLNPIAIREAEAAWLNDEEYEPTVPTRAHRPGWHTGEDASGGQSIHYRPSGHSDPLIRAWVGYAVHSRHVATTPEEHHRANEALAYLLNPKYGLGGVESVTPRASWPAPRTSQFNGSIEDHWNARTPPTHTRPT